MKTKFLLSVSGAGPGVRPIQVSVPVCDLAASKSGSGAQAMQFEQYEKCMEDLGVYNGEICRPYHDAQQTQQGIPDRSVRPVGQDNRYRLSDLEWLILSKVMPSCRSVACPLFLCFDSSGHWCDVCNEHTNM